MKTERLQQIEEVIAAGPFSASWDSLEAYTVPDWYQDDKFGIFIHWGPYAVPGFGNEWYPRRMYEQGSPEYQHHVETYGPHSEFGYKDFVPMFRGEQFDAREWARLFREAGARFVMPVAEHHDGFQMYDSDLSRWNAVQMGPERDILGELAEAVRAEEMVFCASSHRAEHWWYFGDGRAFDSDVNDPAYADLYGPAHGNRPHEQYLTNPPDQDFLEDWLLRTCELVDRYRPQVVWFDWWIMNLAFKPYLKKFAAYYYNSAAKWGVEVAINHKYDAYPAGTAVFDIERGQVGDVRGLFWQSDTSVSKSSWGYIEGHNYKTADVVISDLIDVVSKNGALLLNVGPRADGVIPTEEQALLREIGGWLEVNGEGIFGTRPWLTPGEGPTHIPEGAHTDRRRSPFTSADIRFTTRGDTLYAHVLSWPDDGRVSIKSLGATAPHAFPRIDAIHLLGRDEPLQWTQSDHALAVDVGSETETSNPFTLKVVRAQG